MANVALPLPVQIFSQVSESANQDMPKDLQLNNCYIDKIARPSNTLEMNTAVFKSILTIITVQKEAFICSPTKGQNFNVDIGLYVMATNYLENGTALVRTIEAITCIKDQNATILSCSSEQPMKNLPEAKCATQRPYSRGPIILSTEAGSGNLSSVGATIELDSDVIRCQDLSENPILKDMLSFTQITHNFDNMSSKKVGDTISCMKSIVNLKVLGCNIEKIM
jgi:hypothetical protein